MRLCNECFNEYDEQDREGEHVVQDAPQHGDMCEECSMLYDETTTEWHDDSSILKKIPFGQKEVIRIYGVQLFDRTDEEIVYDLMNVVHHIRQRSYSSVHLVGRSLDIPQDGNHIHIVQEG